MKKGILINIILIVLIYIIPSPKAKEIIQSASENIKTEITSRGASEIRTEPIKNTELNPESDLRVLSNLSENDYNNMLSGTRLEGLGGTFVQIENQYNINGLYILGLACLESNFGKSNFAVQRNNLVGWNAVDSNPNKASYFNSKEECLTFVSNKLKTNYLSESGCYFEGFTGRNVDKHYCTDKNHIDKICNIVNKLIKKI